MKFSQWLSEKFDEYLEYGSRFHAAWLSKYYAMVLVIPLTIFFFLIVLFISSWNSNLLWIKNKISPNRIVVEQHGLNPSDRLKIKWTLSDTRDTLLIFDDGQIIKNDFKSSGENLFLVYINDSLIFKKDHYKNIQWKGYKYTFRIEKVNNKYSSILTIK